jgi:hypothetical protein
MERRMSRKVLVPIPRQCLDHLRLRPGETPCAVIWGRHVVLLRPFPVEEMVGMFKGLLGPFDREADRLA